VTILIIAFFTIAAVACVAVLVRGVGSQEPAVSSEDVILSPDENQAELASLRELVLELRKELRMAQREAERTRQKAVSSNVNLKRALSPGGEVELVVAELLRGSKSRGSLGRSWDAPPAEIQLDHVA